MKKDEKSERLDRAARLVEARKSAGFRGPQAVADRFGFNVNVYKAHEQGRNGFGIADAKAYAKAFGVALNWLNFGIGLPSDKDEEPADLIPVPLISWVSAGALAAPDHSQLRDMLDEVPRVYTIDLDPSGD